MRSFMNKLSTVDPLTTGHYYDYLHQCIKFDMVITRQSMVYCSGGKSFIDIYDRLTQGMIMIEMFVGLINSGHRKYIIV